jgi:PKD repeat protein
VSNPPVTSNVAPIPTPDPSSTGDSAYTLLVPSATETLVVKLDTNATSKNDLVPRFVGPDGHVVTRDQLMTDSIVGGDGSFGGVSEVMNIDSPRQGTWLLKLHKTTSGQIAVRLLATALFHVHRPPLVSIKASQTSGRAPLVVDFDASATQLDSTSAIYCWTFTDGTRSDIAMGVRVSHTFSAPGNYHALLIVIDAEQRAGYSEAQVTATN